MLWLILGLLIGVGFVLLARQKRVHLAWFDWVLLALAAVGILFAIQNYLASLEELEPTAASLMLVMFGVPSLILAAIVAIRAFRSTTGSPAVKPAASGKVSDKVAKVTS